MITFSISRLKDISGKFSLMDSFGDHTTNTLPKILLKSLTHVVNEYEQSGGETFCSIFI